MLRSPRKSAIQNSSRLKKQIASDRRHPEVLSLSIFGDIISAAEFLKSWKNRNVQERQRIYDYLDTLAKDAELLGEAWADILQEIEQRREIDYYFYVGKRVKELTDPPGPEDPHLSSDASPVPSSMPHYLPSIHLTNMPYHSRLSVFYRRLAFVLGEEDKRLRESLLGKLAELLRLRSLLREDLEEKLGVRGLDVEKFRTLVEAINDQAAELSIFIKEVRARSE